MDRVLETRRVKLGQLGELLSETIRISPWATIRAPRTFRAGTKVMEPAAFRSALQSAVDHTTAEVAATTAPMALISETMHAVLAWETR